MYHLTRFWFMIVVVTNVATWFIARRHERNHRAKQLRGEVQ